MFGLLLFATVAGETSHLVRSAARTEVSTKVGIQRETFTTNAICRKKFCVNPVFPGLEDLRTLERQQYNCRAQHEVSAAMSFCQSAVTYDVAIPAPEGGAKEVPQLVREQEQLAMTMYAYHLSGMGIEFWDNTDPWAGDDCTHAVWRMVCYTYFPKCELNAEPGNPSTYLRPCQSSCHNYLKSCNVECCDESVQCVFEHSKQESDGTTFVQTGYVPHSGPSSLCTGAASRYGLGVLAALLLGVDDSRASAVAAVALLAGLTGLQGCDAKVPEHNVGNWRAEEDYLIKYAYLPPGAGPADSILNSCSLDRLAQTLQCSGRGICKPWDDNNLNNPVMFCDCDRDWADPECRTPRKSQVVAYLLSLFLGPFGADLFYLGYPILGALKLCTLGGCGLWWLLDIIRVGSAPVYAHDYRCSADLPHWAFVLSVVAFMFTVGFLVTGCSTFRHIRRKRKDALLLQAEEALHAHDFEPPPPAAQIFHGEEAYARGVPRPGSAPAGFAGAGYQVQPPMPNYGSVQRA